MRETSRTQAGRHGLTGAWEPHSDPRAQPCRRRRAPHPGTARHRVRRSRPAEEHQRHNAGTHRVSTRWPQPAPRFLDPLRSHDLVLRYGGDEFACALPHARTAQAENRVRHVAGLLHAAAPGTSLSSGRRCSAASRPRTSSRQPTTTCTPGAASRAPPATSESASGDQAGRLSRLSCRGGSLPSTVHSSAADPP